jgi:hypothetical protein
MMCMMDNGGRRRAGAGCGSGALPDQATAALVIHSCAARRQRVRFNVDIQHSLQARSFSILYDQLLQKVKEERKGTRIIISRLSSCDRVADVVISARPAHDGVP